MINHDHRYYIVWVAIIHIHHHKWFPVSPPLPVFLHGSGFPAVQLLGSGDWAWTKKVLGVIQYMYRVDVLYVQTVVLFLVLWCYLFTHAECLNFFGSESLKLSGIVSNLAMPRQDHACGRTNWQGRGRGERALSQGAWPDRATGETSSPHGKPLLASARMIRLMMGFAGFQVGHDIKSFWCNFWRQKKVLNGEGWNL